MTIPYIGGADDVINPAVGNIASAIEQIVQPYKRTEIALRGAIAEHPELAQKLTDMEFMSPGSTGSLFGPNAGSYFSSLRPSNDAIIEKTVTPFIEKALKSPDIASFVGASRATEGKATPGTIEEDKYKGRIAKATAEAVEASPDLMGAATVRKATGLPVGTYAEQQVKANTAATAAKIIATEKPDILITKLLKGVTGEEGGYTPGELNAIFSQPMGKALDFQLRAKLADEANATREGIAKMKIGQDDAKREDAIRKLLVYNALLESRTTGYSTPAAFLALNLGPDNPLVQEFGGVTPDQLVQAQLARGTTQRQFNEKGSIAAIGGIRSLMGLFLKAKANDADSNELAGIVSAMQAAGNPYGINVLYDEKNGLRALNPDGTIIKPENTVTSVGPGSGTRTATPNTPPSPTKVGGGGAAGAGSRTSVSVSGPPKSLSDAATTALGILDQMQAGQDPRSRAAAKRKFSDDLRERAGKSRAAKAVYDELKAKGLVE